MPLQSRYVDIGFNRSHFLQHDVHTTIMQCGCQLRTVCAHKKPLGLHEQEKPEINTGLPSCNSIDKAVTRNVLMEQTEPIKSIVPLRCACNIVAHVLEKQYSDPDQIQGGGEWRGVNGERERHAGAFGSTCEGTH